jgi:hypothetical protein
MGGTNNIDLMNKDKLLAIFDLLYILLVFNFPFKIMQGRPTVANAFSRRFMPCVLKLV